MKSATAKSFLIQVKEFFSIADEAMDEFVVIADNKRKAEGEVITALECKSIKKSADQTGRRVHCPRCGFQADRDVNSSKNHFLKALVGKKNY